MEILNNQKIKDISHSGHGIVKNSDNSKTPDIYVLGAFPGDILNINIYKKLNNIWYGEILEILKYSKYREVFPDEKPFLKANIPWENLSRKGEYKLKKIIFKEIFKNYKRKIKKSYLNNEISFSHYRNKAAYAFIENNNQLAFALYNRGVSGQDKTFQDENTLIHPVLQKIADDFLDFFNQKSLKKIDIKYLILRYSYLTNSVVVHILFPNSNHDILPFKKEELENFKSQNENIQGILVSYSNPEIRSTKTEKDFYEIGNIDICEKVLDNKYNYHPSLFFQIYPEAFQEIILDIRKFISSIKNNKELEVLDLFAGIGILGISVSDLVKNVIGVEHSQLSKKYALQNAELNNQINNLQNFDFIEDSVDNILKLIKQDQILIVDPVRSGLSKDICHKINIQKPKYIIYVSCNPQTQVRDIERIKDDYKIISIKQYNILPKTHHLEGVVILKRR